MLRNILLLLLALCLFTSTKAQTDSSHLRISLITCGPADEEVWEVFGHTAVRIIDSTKHTDVVYNYGTFEFGPNFEIQFMRGKLLYSLMIDPFSNFMQEYVQANRSVQEQVLLLDWKQKERVQYFLNWNAEPENKYYKYDFFFDNCATRIRDIFPRPEIFGKSFQFAETRPLNSKQSFRDIINQYFYRDHWVRFGVNILLGSKIDKVMTNADIMFLPDYLSKGLAGATANGVNISTQPVTILPGQTNGPATINTPFLVTLLILILTIAGLSFKRLHVLGRVMSSLLLLITGLLGVLILIMWFGTDHQGCADNYNLLWCLPTNLALAFARPKGRSRYALIAICLLFVTLILHITRVQGLTLFELAPLLLALLFVYGTIYRSKDAKPAPKMQRQPETTNPELSYRKMGSGPAVVLLHGFPESGTLWSNIWSALAANNTVIIPDLPGSGNSALTGDTGISRMADEVKAILDKEGIEQAVIGGHSMGGYVAFAFADKYPGMVAGLSLVHTTAQADDDEKKKLRSKTISLIQKGGKNVFIKEMVPNLFSDSFRAAHPEIVEEQVVKALAMDEAGMVNFYKAMMERKDRTNVLTEAIFPLQWIAGNDDNVIPAQKTREQCYISDVNFVSFYNNCGHMSMLEVPEELTADLKDFINYCYQ